MSMNPETLEQMIDREYQKVINPDLDETAISVAFMRMTELINQRTPETIERMEQEKGIRQ